MMNAKFLAVWIVVFSILVAGCAGAETSAPSSSPQAWIDAPLAGANYPLAEIEVISHASAGSGVAQFELSVDGTVVRVDAAPAAPGELVLMSQSWLPASPGTYLVQVRAQSTEGEWSAKASVQVTVGDVTQVAPTLDVVAPDAPAAISSATATAVFTATEAGPLILTFVQSAFCREGPGTVYVVVTGMTAGDVATIQGRNESGNWLYVFWPKVGLTCWVAASTGTASGGVDGVTVLVAPPTPVSVTATTVASDPGGGGGSILIEAPTHSGGSIYNISGCGDPSTLTIRVNALNAMQVRIDYSIGAVAYSAQMEDRGAGTFRFVMQSGPQYAGNSGPMTYSIVASNANESVTIAQVQTIDVLNCKP